MTHAHRATLANTLAPAGLSCPHGATHSSEYPSASFQDKVSQRCAGRKVNSRSLWLSGKKKRRKPRQAMTANTLQLTASPRWRRIWYSASAAATETLNEPTAAALPSGSARGSRSSSRPAGARPEPSAPSTRHERHLAVDLRDRLRIRARRATATRHSAELAQLARARARGCRPARSARAHCARRVFATVGGYLRRAMLGDDYAARAEQVRRAQDRAQVARILDAVERDPAAPALSARATRW